MIRLSVILPFYKKAALFRAALPKNELYAREGVELVCCLDHSDDELPLLQIVRDYPAINFRVIVNDQPHEWRPPCKAYNVGIRHALADHVLLTDPESVLELEDSGDLDFFLYRNTAASGLTWMVPGEANPDHEADIPPWTWTLGALLCPKSAIEDIGGYDESRTTYGFDDTDLRNRLLRNGTRIIVDGRFKIFHPEHDQALQRRHGIEPCGTRIVLEHQLHSYGLDFGRMAYDWNETH